MKEQMEFDSDELFDPSSDGSEEEYIPKSVEDTSEDTDTSDIIVSIDQKMKNKLIFPNLGKMVDVRDECLSLQELDNTSLKPTIERGRSPIRKESTSGKRHRRRCSSSVSCPTTRTSTGNATKQSGGGDTGALLEDSPTDLEKNLPDGASSLGGISDCLPAIPAVCKKEDGSRIYN